MAYIVSAYFSDACWEEVNRRRDFLDKLMSFNVVSDLRSSDVNSFASFKSSTIQVHS